MRIIILLFLLVSSCKIIDLEESAFSSKASGHDLSGSPFICDFGDSLEAAAWIADNIDYRRDKAYDIWDDPEETIERGYGDCEDIALLFMDCLHSSLGARPKLVVGKSYNMWHVIVEYEGELIDPRSWDPGKFDPEYYFSFKHVFGE